MTDQSRFGTDKSISMSEQQVAIIYGVCHVMGMVSACANPIIYGFLNENFNREFMELYKKAKNSFCCLCTKISSNTFLTSSPGANGHEPPGISRNGKGFRCADIFLLTIFSCIISHLLFFFLSFE